MIRNMTRLSMTMLGLLVALNACAVVWNWNTAGDLEGWTPNGSLSSLTASGTELVATYNGAGDPFIWSPSPLGLNGTTQHVLIIALTMSVAGPQDFQIFYRRNGYPGDAWEEHSFHWDIDAPAGVKKTYVVNIPEKLAAEGKPNDWTGFTIDSLRFDIGGGYPSGNTCRIDYMALVGDLDWQFNTDGDSEHWSNWNPAQINVFNVAGGALEVGFVNTSAGDPHIGVSPTYFDCDTYKWARIRQNAVGHNGSEALGGECHYFPSSVPGHGGRAWTFYPNVGYSTIILDMQTGYYTAGQWTGLGNVTSFRVDNTTDALTNWQPNGRIYYDRIALMSNPSDAGPYLWDMSGSGPGSWVAPRHSPFGGAAVNVSGGAATVTGSGQLGMGNFDVAIDSGPNHYLLMDVNVVTSAPRTDFSLRPLWAVNGQAFNTGDRKRLYTVPTNVGTRRYIFDLALSPGQPAGHTGAWAGYVHGLLMQIGDGEAGVTSVAFDNIQLLQAMPSAPTLVVADVSSGATVDVTFSQQMGTGVTGRLNYTISGTGRGSLTAAPDSVAYLYGHTYRLTWNSGEMLNGADVIITAGAAIQDIAGNTVGTPSSATDTGGAIGTPPQVQAVAVETGLTALVTFNEAMGSGVTTAANYTASGTGLGTLAANPTGVALVSGNQYRLTWASGEMRNGSPLTITVANAQDAAGNPIGTTNNSGSGTGIGVRPNATAITPVTASPTNSGTVQFTVVFDESVQGLNDLADFALGTSGDVAATGATVSGGPTTFTVSITGVTGDGALNLRVRQSDVTDLAGNLLETSVTSANVTIDNTGPTATTITPTTPSPTNADTVSYTVVFDEAVVNFDAEADLVIVETGSVAHSGVSITGGPASYTVNITGVTGDGMMTLAVNVPSDITDLAGNALLWSITGAAVTLDNTGPAVMDIAGTTPSPSNSSSYSFRVDFSDEVLGFADAADLDITTTGTLAYSSIGFTPYTPTRYFVQFIGLTGAGTLRVAVDTASDVTDLYGNPLVSSMTGEAVIDRVGPVVTVNTLTTNDTTPTVTGTVDDGAGTGVQSVTATVNGVQYTATVTGTNWSAEVTNALAQGTYNVQARATDLLGNIGNDATTNELVIDFSVPAATVNSLRTSDTTPTLTGTATAPVGYTITQVTVTVDGQAYAANISALPTWTANITNALAEGIYNVQVQARDNMGRIGTDGTLNELTIDLTGPVAAISLADANPTLADTVTFDVAFNEPIQAGSFNAADVTVTGSLAGIAVTPVTVGGSGQAYTVDVTVTNSDADGTLGIEIGTGVTDPYGNATAGAVSELYTISNWYGFTQEPTDARVYVGEPVSFSVQADYGSSTPTYQWKHDNLEDKAVVDVGTSSPTYDIVATTPADTGQYWCVVTYGGVEYASAPAMLDVVGHLSITQHPEGGNKAVGNSHTFSVATEGGIEPLDYVWFKGDVAITGATLSSYSIPSLTVNDSGSYHAVVSDSGTDVQASTTAVLEVSGSSLPAASGAAALAALAGLFAAGGLTALRRRRS